MIKLLLLIPTLDQSGAEKQFSLLARRLPRTEFDVRVVALARGGPLEESLRQEGIPVTVLHKRWRLDPTTILRVRRELGTWQPDIVLSGLFAANATSRLATIGLRNRPRIVISERCVDSWKAGWQLAVDRWLTSRTDCLVANSNSVADFYREQGFPDARLSVIPNGVAAPPVPGISRAELCAQLNLPADALLVAYVGRLASQKRIRDLLWGAQLLRQADPRAYLLLIGDGPERAELELYAEDIEVSQHARFLGHRSDAASLLHLVDVFWLASAFEGMSNSLMEAMACGRPAVVSDIPANRELVRHGIEGWIVNLGDSVGFSQFTLQLLHDPEMARRLGEAGKSRMDSEFSLTTMVDRYRDLLRSEAGKT